MRVIPMKKKTGPSKGRIIAFSIAIFLVAAILSGLWYWNTHKKAIVRNKLETVVREKSNGLYKIKYDSLRMDEINGYLSISDMNFSYDSTRYRELTKAGKEPSILLDIHIPEISVSGVKTPRALIGKEIVGRKLEIKNPVIHIIYTGSGPDPSQAVAPKAIYEQILGNLDLIQADSILISGAQIHTSNRKTKRPGMQLQDVFITLVNVKVDSSSNADTSLILFAKEAHISCGKLAWSSPDNLYNYSAASISVNSVSRQLLLKNFRMAPTINEEAFVNSLPTQDDRFDFSVSDVRVQSINLQQLLEEKIIADHIIFPSPSLKIYRDLAIPRDKKNRVGAYPHQLMQTIPVLFHINKLTVTDGFIEYKERHAVSRLAGKIQYYHVNAAISNFTNDKKAIAVNNIMTVEMSTRFLNQASLKVTGRFYLLHPKGRFDLEGTFGAMDGRLLNPVIECTGLTRIKTGKINGAWFSLQGEDYNIDGSVKILYEDLKVAALEKDLGSAQLDKKSFSSFLVNIKIKNSNPSGNDDPRVAQVHLDRNTNASFFNFAWKSVFQGLMGTVGLKQ